jgi:NAD(P)-dependent dehydrogenase (short-subunit alcohol dehydrogenase family)
MTETNMFDLSGRVALVTAGGHGLGRAYCEGLAEFGADVAVNDIDPKLAQETVEFIKRYGHRAIAIQADVSKQDQIERMVDQTVTEFGKVDILFCNAGTSNTLVRLHEIAVEDWDKVMNLNVRGSFLCMKTVLPLMLKQKKGSIILTASVGGMRANTDMVNIAPYGISKAAVIGITKHAAVAYAKDGIRINAIAPGAHESFPLWRSREHWEKIHEMISKTIPLGRVGKPSDLKGLAVYLASDASSYVTGQVFVQDGGYIA